MTDRTKYEAVLDCRYGYWFNDLNERWYRRIDMAFTITSLAFAGSAVVGVLTSVPWIGTGATVVVSVLAVAHAVLRPIEAAANHREAKRAYLTLDACAESLDLAAFDKRLREVQGGAPTGLRALAPVAYNACLRANGYGDQQMKEPGLSRALAMLV